MDRLFRRGLWVVALTALACGSGCAKNSVARGESRGSTQTASLRESVIDPSTGQAVASRCAVVDGVTR